LISEKKIDSNKEYFLKINKEYEVFTDELLEFLGEDFFVAPFSPSLDMAACYPGGLLDFLMKICKYAVNVSEVFPENIRPDKKSIVRTSFLSQIGKTFLFEFNKDKWMAEKKGKIYQYRDDEIVIMGVSERSVYYALRYGVKLNDEEYQTIMNLDKDSSEKFMRGSKPLYYIIKAGLEIALLEEKKIREDEKTTG